MSAECTLPPQPPAVHGELDGELAEDFARSLVYEHAPPLRRYVSRLLPSDGQRTDDIVQETLLRAWRHRASLCAHQSARPWLFRVARNLSVDWYRRQGARPTEVALEGVENPDLDAGDRLEDVLRRQVLTDALASVSSQHRQVVILLYYLGLTQAEVAERLGIAQGTVKSRAHYALTEIRKTIVAAGILQPD